MHFGWVHGLVRLMVRRDDSAALGIISHLELALRCTSTSDPKAFPKWLRNGETAWPGELKDTVF